MSDGSQGKANNFIEAAKQAARERLANSYDQGDADSTWMVQLAADIRAGKRDDLLEKEFAIIKDVLG